MKLIKVAAGVLNQTPLDWDNNLSNILDAIQAARDEDVSLLCLPELCITGYGCEDAFHSPGVLKTALRQLPEIVEATQGMVVCVGLPVAFAGGIFNVACLLVDGAVVGFVAKKFLAGDGIHYEPRWFKPWPSGSIATIEWDGVSYPIGDLIFNCGEIKIGFEICEDAWVGERPGAGLAARGVDVILNPSASHFAFDKHQIRQRFVLEGSRAFQVSYIYSNLVGNEAGRAIYDGDAMIASCGTMVAHGDRFTYRRTLLTTGVIDIDKSRMLRARTSSFQPAISTSGNEFVACSFAWPDVSPSATSCVVQGWEASSSIKEEEFARAVALGLFDYMRKSWSNGFVVSLSGGADSSSVVSLIKLMVDFAISDIGLAAFYDRLAYIPRLAAGVNQHEILGLLLTTVYQATRNSTAVTRDAAKQLADAIGASHLEFDVDEIVESYQMMVAQGIGRELTWEQDDLALQNIQARVRAPGVWMLANIKGALLLSTSNRSEAAVGYATMDGDTSGGLSPIAGIDKAFLRRWLVWLQSDGPDGLGPIDALDAVTAQQPTAELRPHASGQTDEEDLMPYDVLDMIERQAIRDKLVPDEVFANLRASYPDVSDSRLYAWTDRFFKLWSRNQWKRERYAPSFHLDDENLDPKTWCRFPILSGGFRSELSALQKRVEESYD